MVLSVFGYSKWTRSKRRKKIVRDGAQISSYIYLTIFGFHSIFPAMIVTEKNQMGGKNEGKKRGHNTANSLARLLRFAPARRSAHPPTRPPTLPRPCSRAVAPWRSACGQCFKNSGRVGAGEGWGKGAGGREQGEGRGGTRWVG